MSGWDCLSQRCKCTPSGLDFLCSCEREPMTKKCKHCGVRLHQDEGAGPSVLDRVIAKGDAAKAAEELF